MAKPTEKLKMWIEHDWLIIPCHNGTTWRFHLRLGHETRADLLRADLNAIAPGCCEVPAKPLIAGTIRVLKRGGGEKCPRTCSDCDGNHHWIEHCIHPADFDAENPPEQHETEAMAALPAVDGMFTYLACKHCDAWIEACPECQRFPCECDGFNDED